MKKHLILTGFILFGFLIGNAQKKNYFSLETGLYFGNANANIESNMVSSGFGDDEVFYFLIFGPFTTHYPRKHSGKTKYRIRGGHLLDNKTAIEAGFGLSSYGTVEGFDARGNSGNYLTLTSKINTLYFAYMKSDARGSAGYGVGPAFSFYQLTSEANKSAQTQSKNYLLPGAMITGFWNFITHRSWFAGIRSEISFTAPAKIDEIKITNPGDPSIESRFKAVKAGSINGSITLNAGIRF